MSLEDKLYKLLNLRRRIDRKILFQEKWPFKHTLRSIVELLLITKNIKTLWLEDQQLYLFLNKEIRRFSIKHNLIKPIPELKIESINDCNLIPWWFNNLKIYDKKLGAIGASLLIQGSYADSRITNYSDVDLVIFYHPFSKDVLKIKKEIEVFLLKIDPLQHHGVFMIDVTTFDFYWQMDLPLEVLKKAKCFSDNKCTLQIKGILKENTAALYAVKSTLITIKQFLNKDYKQIGLWEWKFFISQLLLLPTLLLESKGSYIYKRDSFEIAKKLFTQNAWYCIDRASYIRNQWPELVKFREYQNVRISVSQKPSKDPIRMIDLPLISTERDLEFADSLKALIEETASLISHD